MFSQAIFLPRVEIQVSVDNIEHTLTQVINHAIVGIFYKF